MLSRQKYELSLWPLGENFIVQKELQSLTFRYFCRKDADDDLERMAEISGGKTYFVNDGKSNPIL